MDFFEPDTRINSTLKTLKQLLNTAWSTKKEFLLQFDNARSHTSQSIQEVIKTLGLTFSYPKLRFLHGHLFDSNEEV